MSDTTDATLAQAVERWALVIDGAPQRSASGCVAFARRVLDGRHVVVKVADSRSDELRGVAALRHFAGRACVAVLDQAGAAALLERALPGRPLVETVLAGRDDEATAILCDVAGALHRSGVVGDAASTALPHVFPSVEEWGRGFDRYRVSGDARIPTALLGRASALFVDLAASQTERRLLHGDLQHYNVLWDDRRGWLAIDPKGVLGEAAYEFGAMLRNPVSMPALVASASVADRRGRIVAERAALDRERVLGWAFAQAVLSAVWDWEDDGHASDFSLAAATALEGALRRRSV